MGVLKIAKTEYPFEITPKGRAYIKQAAVNLSHVEKKAKNETKRFAYLICKGACETQKIEFSFRWEEFVQFVEQDCVDKAVKMLSSMRRADKKAKSKQKKEKKAAEDAKASNSTAGAGSVPGTDTSQDK
jgi:ATP adenylyltransferase/5',5'''-P-1,P-4-tetraphosphate phosphorylase II